MKAHCIVNPVAGKGLTDKLWNKIWLTLQHTGFDLSYQFTTEKGDATELAKKAVADGAELIITVGGDGTINEVVNGMVGTQAKLGIIPTGTGNDFVRSVNIPLDPIEASIVIENMTTMMVDLGKIGEKHFLNVAGIGFDAQVAKEVNRGTGFLTGKPAYLWAIIKVMFYFKPVSIVISGEDQKFAGEILVVALANARYYGGGMEIAPQARVDDGVINVVLIEGMSKIEFIRSFSLLLKGQHLDHPKVKIFSGRSFSLSGSDTINVHADGDLIKGLPLKLNVVPKALEIIVP